MLDLGFIARDDADTTLVGLALAAGHKLRIGSVDSQLEDILRTRRELASDSPLTLCATRECASCSDVVFLDVPRERWGELPLPELRGRIVALLCDEEGMVEGGRALQELTAAHLVCLGLGERDGQGKAAATVRSDWSLAKAVLLALLADFGFEPRDLGELSEPAGEGDLLDATARRP